MKRKLTDKQVEQMKRLVKQGKLQKLQIASQFGVNVTTLYYHLDPKKRTKNVQKWYRKKINHAK